MSAELGTTVWRTGATTFITIERPEKGNSLSASTVLAISAAVRSCYEDGTRLLVLRGAGRHFCTGFDLSNLESETNDTLLARFVRVELLLQDVYHAPFATLAIASGRAMGAGADLFCACDQRWALESASFAFPGAAFGLVLGSSRLANRVGTTRAREWIRSGETVGAADALNAGLVDRVVEEGDVDGGIEALASQSVRLGPAAMKAIHAATLAAEEASRDRDLRALVLSASAPSLMRQIDSYRERLKKP
ncbi:enoyl-CoA hydratase/isomerase family protein [Caenimonas soli]|uniref:enoyl-CoA hydratase/isomerase family protein n=1 Tax=Caenimonas soli TaxID=2735555 RepID=UPI0015541CE0|nr:enoyl-CoA hydratase/isomerase family protein [Caenimonas soli]NPC58525.1 enoyl-CoA hydratase/isomerase family protein [Caenimonas soli]